jgi:hypothetical protein
MEIRKLISKFLTSLCEKNYAQANADLKNVVEAKIKTRVSKLVSEKKSSPKQKAQRAKFLEMIKNKNKKGGKDVKKDSKTPEKTQDKKKSEKGK